MMTRVPKKGLGGPCGEAFSDCFPVDDAALFGLGEAPCEASAITSKEYSMRGLQERKQTP